MRATLALNGLSVTIFSPNENPVTQKESNLLHVCGA